MKIGKPLFFISLTLMILTFIFNIGIITFSQKNTVETDCYDRHNNVIKDKICYEEKFEPEYLNSLIIILPAIAFSLFLINLWSLCIIITSEGGW